MCLLATTKYMGQFVCSVIPLLANVKMVDSLYVS